MNIAHMYIREINEDEEQWDSYVKSFHENLWMVLILWVLVSGLTMGVIAWAALKFLGLNGFTLFDQALTPLTAFCNQACGCLPMILSSRIARLSIYVAPTIIIPAYSASLVSFLTVHIPKIPFTDLESFADDGSYKLALFHTPLMVSYFTRSHDPVIQRIAEKQLIPREEFPKTHDAAIKLLCSTDDLAVMNYNYRMLQLPSPCPIIRVSDIIFDLFGGIEVTNDGARYKGTMQILILRIRTSGILQKMQQMNLGQTEFEDIEEFEAISIIETKSIMVFILLSLLTSILLLSGELLYFSIKKKIKSKSSNVTKSQKIFIAPPLLQETRRGNNQFYTLQARYSGCFRISNSKELHK